MSGLSLIIECVFVTCLLLSIRDISCSPIPRCVWDCHELGPGFYPSCYGCEHYIECANRMTYNRTCPPARLWNPEFMRCDRPNCVECSDGSRRPPGFSDPGPEPTPRGFPEPKSSFRPPQDPSITDSPEPSDFPERSIKVLKTDQCLSWMITCLVALILLVLVSVLFLMTRLLGQRKKKQNAVDTYMQWPDDASIPSYREATTRNPYEGVYANIRYAPTPYRDLSANTSILCYQNLFPIYEELSEYRDRYLELHGYTYLQLVQHVGDDTTRKEIARSVGPLYLTLCHQYETNPKKFEDTQLRLRSFVHDAWKGSITPSEKTWKGTITPSEKTGKGSITPSEKTWNGSITPSEKTLEGTITPSEKTITPLGKILKGSITPSKTTLKGSITPSDKTENEQPENYVKDKCALFEKNK